MKVLVIEDEPLMEALLRATFEPLGHQVVASRSGDRIEALLAAHDPDVVVLDVVLTGSQADGFEVCRRIKTSPYRDTFVVMLTALDSDESRKKGQEAGADAYLAKPFSPLELLHLAESRTPT